MAPPPSGDSDAALAQRLLDDRRLRAGFFAPGLFAEPAWEMMLELFVAGERGAPLAVTRLCRSAGVPATTALRWVNILTERGLVVRAPDHADARRHFLRLSPAAERGLRDYLAALRSGLLPLEQLD